MPSMFGMRRSEMTTSKVPRGALLTRARAEAPSGSVRTS